MPAKTYIIEYDFTVLATVEIDKVKAADVIKDMVEFWHDWESRLAHYKGNYQTTWLKMLGMFILRRRRLPTDDEGWYELDGSRGIKATLEEEWEPDEAEICIDQRRAA